MSIIRHIPNGITSLNLFSGCAAIVAAFNGQFQLAAGLIVLAAIFDFFDGLAARALKAYSDIGKELDSLADMVSFGVAPSVIFFKLIQVGLGFETGFVATYLPYIAFIIAVFSALRLAKFNIDTRQTTSFIGLPTPANAMFLISFGLYFESSLPYKEIVTNPWVLIAVAAIFSWLLVAEIPMFAMKIKSLKLKGNEVRYIFLALSLALIILLQEMALLGIIPLYILISILTQKKKVA